MLHHHIDPGYIMTSMVVVDQHGDLNIDTKNFNEMKPGERFYPKVNPDFKLIVKEPQSCPTER